MTEQATKVWTKDEIQTKLALTDAEGDAWLYRAVIAIYSRQTEQEQSQDATHNDNGVGFSGSDAFIMSRFAKQLLDMKAKRLVNPNQKVFLTENQLVIARKKILKYAGQLVKIIQRKI